MGIATSSIERCDKNSSIFSEPGPEAVGIVENARFVTLGAAATRRPVLGNVRNVQTTERHLHASTLWPAVTTRPPPCGQLTDSHLFGEPDTARCWASTDTQATRAYCARSKPTTNVPTCCGHRRLVRAAKTAAYRSALAAFLAKPAAVGRSPGNHD